MTTHKPEVVAYLATWKDGVIHTYNPPVITSDSIERSEPLIRLSDYEALQAECERLLEEVMRLRVAMAKAAQRADDWPDSNDDPADVLSDCASILFDALDYRQGGGE